MPYTTRKLGNEFCVVEKDTGEVVKGGCHKTEPEAISHMRAIIVNAPTQSKK
jgi:hypothetical protein